MLSRALALVALLSAAPSKRCSITTGVNLLSPAAARVDAGVVLSFDGGETTEATLFRGTEVSRGVITSGFSARYGEYFAPELLPRVLVIEGRTFPLLTRTTMGSSGGGGEALLVLIAHDGGLTEQVLGTIGGATTINEATELGPNCTDVLRVQGRVVSLSSCLNGVLQPAQCFEWNGTEFTRR
jgi:hypothetical protein